MMSSFVYFIQSGVGGEIKIGVAKNVKTRMAELQTGNPEELIFLGQIEGDRRTEREIHKKFASHRLRGEWFECCHSILEFIGIKNSKKFIPKKSRVHPKDNTVYFPVGYEVLFGDTLALVTGLEIKTFDHPIGYNLKLLNTPSKNKIWHNVGYGMIRTIDGTDFDKSVIYSVNPSDEIWRRNQQDVLLLGRSKNEVDLFGVPYFDPYTCLVNKTQESPRHFRWMGFVANKEAA